jgi:hypothetical protein
MEGWLGVLEWNGQRLPYGRRERSARIPPEASANACIGEVGTENGAKPAVGSADWATISPSWRLRLCRCFTLTMHTVHRVYIGARNIPSHKFLPNDENRITATLKSI